MKITQQLIAAASFASLLFAPLAQAQTADSATGNVELKVIGSGLLFRASDMNFGSVTPHASNADNLVVACTATADGDASTSNGAVAAGDATCGVIEVTGGTSGNTYKLTVDVEDLTNGNGDTIVPTFKVFGSNGTDEVAGLTAVTDASTRTNPATATNAESIAAGAVDTYKLGGSASIAAGQNGGFYTGTYIVSATVS